MAIHFSRRFRPRAIVYDCMDELSAFRGAPPGMRAAEDGLFSRADIVFTGGQSLYEAKKAQHPNVHCCPSSIDRNFFETARRIGRDPQDQVDIPYPRLGYSGVIDERMDLDLLATVASLRPDWHFIMLGPVVKISASELPNLPNIHYLGNKEYRTLPAYMAGWQIGLLPFARNDATRFISPTKTPEYLAAGLPVISTSIADVVRPYGIKKLVAIADEGHSFVLSAERAFEIRHSQDRLDKVDVFLAGMSWDHTWQRMAQLIDSTVSIEDSSLSSEQSTKETLLGTQC
jgi:UDP-galactopyranose mutase